MPTRRRGYPVAIFVHQRMSFLKQQVSCLRKYRPPVVYLVADGPASGDVKQRRLCQQVRREYLQAIDWECNVVEIFSDKRLGLAKRVETGLDAIFHEEKFVIVLEDDCCPKHQFFEYVHQVETKHRKSSKIAGISGSCFLPSKIQPTTDYFFSKYAHCWGWATWSRWWKKYRKEGLSGAGKKYQSYFPHAPADESSYWDPILEKYRRREIQSWAYGWQEFFWQHGLLSVCPSENLVENLGFGQGATNTTDPDVQTGVERNGRLKVPITGPPEEVEDVSFSRVVFQNHYVRMSGRKSLWQKALRRLQAGVQVWQRRKQIIPSAGRLP